MQTTPVNFSDRHAEFIRQSVEGGRYQSANEVVSAALRLLEQQDEQYKLKLEAVRRIADEGFDQIDRGEYELVEPDELDAFMAKIDANVRRSAGR